MIGKKLVDELKILIEVETDTSLAQSLKVSQPYVANLRKKNPVGANQLVNLLKKIYKVGFSAGQKKANSIFIERLFDRMELTGLNDSEIHRKTKISQPSIRNLREGLGTPYGKTIKSLLAWYSQSTIRPLVEFYPIEKVSTNQGVYYKFLNNRKTKDRYVANILEAVGGIYIFYDSFGRALYVGKTGGPLIKRMEQQFKKREVEIYCTNPPAISEKQNISEKEQKKFTKIYRDKKFPLHHCANYISAYHINQPEMIGNIEALLIRAFANDLNNINVERFVIP